ncbi:MAG: LPS export ABC transporter periplasmic protein LptC [Bacteroidota bacterium]|nr:LPS export ABC transporter periplasmic protein LptC [Bacteroidota bacterium]
MPKNILYLLFVILASITAFSCSKENDLKDIQEYTGPIMEMDSAQTLYSDSAVVRVKVLAARQLEFQTGDQEFPEGFYIEFYLVDGSLSSTLRANTGYYSKEKDLYWGVGNVILKNFEKGEQLNTEELFWNKNEQNVFTEKFVTIESQDEVLTGEGLTAKQDFSYYKILRPTGTFSIETAP